MTRSAWHPARVSARMRARGGRAALTVNSTLAVRVAPYCRFWQGSRPTAWRRLVAMSTKKDQEISAKQLKKLGALLADVSRATELRPHAEQGTYKEAQRSVLVAKRKAELRAQQPRIA